MRTVEGTLSLIKELHRRHASWHQEEKALTLKIKAICRRYCDGSKGDAAKLYAALVKGEEHELAFKAGLDTMPLFEARALINEHRMPVHKQMEKLAKKLSVFEWTDGIKGVGQFGLAQIVGECGDIGSYKSVSALWKRMGLAVIDGERQRRVKGADAIEHGYSPSRRAIMFNIGDAIVMHQGGKVAKAEGDEDEADHVNWEKPGFFVEGKEPKEPYGTVYRARLAYETEHHPDLGLKHRMNRARRYVEKRFLRQLYSEWKRARLNLEPTATTPEPLAMAAE